MKSLNPRVQYIIESYKERSFDSSFVQVINEAFEVERGPFFGDWLNSNITLFVNREKGAPPVRELVVFEAILNCPSMGHGRLPSFWLA